MSHRTSFSAGAGARGPGSGVRGPGSGVRGPGKNTSCTEGRGLGKVCASHTPTPLGYPRRGSSLHHLSHSQPQSAKLQTHCLKMTDFRRFLPNGSALWRLHHLKSRPHRHRTRDIASLEIEHADETPIACFKCGETPTTAGAEGTVRPEGTAAVPVGGGGAWLQRPGVMAETHTQNLARNFPWSVFN